MKQYGPILLIDDDAKLRELVVEYLEDYDFDIHTLSSGRDAVSTILAIEPSIVVLDVMMPGKDGFEVLREIRAESAVPVIMLTAKGEDTDRIVGLELGADDYMGKPFNPRELLARIKAILRRLETVSDSGRESSFSKIISGGLTLNVSKQTLLIEDDELELAATEFRLLKALMENNDKALTRDNLMDMVWDKGFSGIDRSIDVHISKLRSQLKPYPAHAKRIKTVWGTGYMFLGAE